MALTPIKDIVQAWQNGKTVLVIIEHDPCTLIHYTFKDRREYRAWLMEQGRAPVHVAFSLRQMLGSLYNA
jgi:hypothetical protein